MRRIAAVLMLLLTTTTAQAGVEDGGGLDGFGYVIGCCTIGPLLFVFTLVILLAIYDWRKAARRRELMNRLSGDDE